MTLSCLGFPFALVPTSNIIGVKFDSRVTFEDHVRDIVSGVTQGNGILRLVKRVFAVTSVFLRCDDAFVLPILEYFSPVSGSAAECHLQLLERRVFGGHSLP